MVSRTVLEYRFAGDRQLLDEGRGSGWSGIRLQTAGDGRHAHLSRFVGEEVVQGVLKVGVGECVGGQPVTEIELGDALRVVVLIPEER